MRILIHALNHAPDPIGIGKYVGELTAWLVAHGHEVRVVTAPPYYPAWRVSPGYAAGRYRREVVDGARVYRCPLWARPPRNGLDRTLHLASFALSSLPMVLWHGITWRPDAVFAVAPAIMGAPGSWLAARFGGAVAWLHIQDFEIDAAFELGIFGGDLPRRLVGAAERWLLRRFDVVSTISEKMRERLMVKGVQESRVAAFPNWVDTEAIHPLDRASDFRDELGISADTVVALYSGNMGEKQGVETLIKVAQKIGGRENIKFVFCGDGAARRRLVDSAAGLENIEFLPVQPVERLNQLLNLADIHLLPQRADAADLVMPSKLSGMLASGRAIVATAHPGTQIAQEVAGCGLIVPPDDVQGMIDAVVELARDADKRVELGRSARARASAAWERNLILTKFEQKFIEAANERNLPIEQVPKAQR